MQLVITVRKEVEDQAQGQALFEAVIEKLKDRPNLKITGHVTNHFELEEEPQ